MIRLGLRARFFLYSNTVIAVTMALVTFFWTLHERRSLRLAVEQRGRSVVEAMVVPINHALDGALRSEELWHEAVASYVEEMVRPGGEIRRVVVSDAAGRVVLASDPELVGSRFPDALSPDAAGGAPSVEIRRPSGVTERLEVRQPLMSSGRFLGTLAVDFSLGPIEREVAAVARRAALVAVVLMLFNSALTALYVETLIRPILTLNEIMKYAGRGDFTVRSTERRSDEVGELSDAFNRMMDELEAARDREKAQRAQLAHTEKMAAVGTLAAGVAHEVNNPLSGVLACLDSIRAHPDDDDMRVRYLDLAQDGLKRIERTVANLLNFSRQREIRPEPTSLNHNMRHVAELVGYQLRRADVEVRFDFDPGKAIVMADHFQMEQLFLNLVLNAIDAMPQGGTLVLRTYQQDSQVIAEVSDTGVGIPDEIRDRIFDPFFTTREVGEGTGLGLAVSDSIVAAHGGSLEVETRRGKGTTFRIRLAAMVERPADGEAR